MTAADILAVSAGAFFGAMLRFAVSKKLNQDAHAPVGTLAVNLFGCLLIGFVMRLQLPGPITFFLVSGFAGSLTTFSTWIKEGIGMMRLGKYGRSILYLAGSVLFGLLFTAAGYVTGGFFTG
ncbi:MULTISPECIES: fluoride efflux transporter FluC [Sporosarcina]|uniref:fluoride efflux transporter FluC n=1 Tax=Sporosarcina TaxID=1569 RepID=UPI00058E3840|nr:MULTISPECIES: CrcB family protein [Sporosarcina]WJY27836.1 CrcB family protein [Sporosarcina sp. 0.2-SM1T-5]